MSSSFELVDDADARLKYSTGNWMTSGNSNEYNITSHGAFSAGATMTFVFNGTMVKVYGTIISKDNALDPISTYTVDGGGRTTFAPVTFPNIQYRQLHFQSEDLSPGEHTLVMETIGPWVWMDYLLYLPLAGDKVDGVMVNETQSLSASSGSTTTSALFTSDTATVSTPTSPSITSNTAGATGAAGSRSYPASRMHSIIIGATVGGVAAVLLVACSVGVLCYRKRRRIRHAQRAPPGHIQTSSSSTMTPFLAQSPTLSAVTKWSPIAASLESSSSSRGLAEERPPAYQQTQ